MSAISDLGDLVNNGLVPDIFRMERAYGIHAAIADNANKLNSSEFGNYGEFFGAVQVALVTEASLAVARLYDPPSERYPTRCIRSVLSLLQQRADELPEVVELTNTARSLQGVEGAGSVVEALGQGRVEFAAALADFYLGVINAPRHLESLERLRYLRDKRLAHNESASPGGPTWDALKGLVTLAQEFAGILGWAFLRTVYVVDGRYFLSDDSARSSRAFRRLVGNLPHCPR